MSNATVSTRAEIARELAANIGYDGERNGATATLPDGSRVRAWMQSDADATLGGDTDYFGALKWTDGDRYGRGQRPADFDGAARKITTRRGPDLWWQPPEDVKRDPALAARLFDRVQAYYLEHWHYVGVVVEIDKAPCACCGARAKDRASLWGVESDAGADYFAEILDDLLHEIGVVVPASLEGSDHA